MSAKEYVYIISNKAMPGLYKVGYTSKDPQLRARELNSTGVPYGYFVEYEILINNAHATEKAAHRKLAQYREGKEWFRCSFETCVEAIHSVYHGKIFHECDFQSKKASRNHPESGLFSPFFKAREKEGQSPAPVTEQQGKKKASDANQDMGKTRHQQFITSSCPHCEQKLCFSVTASTVTCPRCKKIFRPRKTASREQKPRMALRFGFLLVASIAIMTAIVKLL